MSKILDFEKWIKRLKKWEKSKIDKITLDGIKLKNKVKKSVDWKWKKIDVINRINFYYYKHKKFPQSSIKYYILKEKLG